MEEYGQTPKTSTQHSKQFLQNMLTSSSAQYTKHFEQCVLIVQAYPNELFDANEHMLNKHYQQ
jgi:hypothetical protein